MNIDFFNMSVDDPPITQDELCGPPIRAVHQSYQLVDGWLDQTETYFEMESGLVFSLGFADSPIARRGLPQNAERMDTDYPELTEQAIGQSIEGLYVEDPHDWDSSVFLLLANGYWLSMMLCAPNGTGASGLYLDKPGEFSASDFHRHDFTLEDEPN